MKRLILIITVLLALLAAGAPGALAQRVTVSATINPLGNLIREVGGERVEVQVLLPPGASPHVFEPTMGTAKKLSQSVVFFVVGAGLDFWAEKLAKGVNRDIKIVAVSEGINLLQEECARGHEHRASNPHVWLDPVLAMEIVRTIEKALEKADPRGAGLYRKRSAEYIEKLKSLDAEIRRTVSTFAIRDFVSFHPAWDYFSLRYGLKSVGVIEESPGKEPSPRKLESIVRAIKAHHIRAVFAEPQLNSKVAEVIAREAGVKVILLDPEGGTPGRETYLNLMRYNLSQMQKAMQ